MHNTDHPYARGEVFMLHDPKEVLIRTTYQAGIKVCMDAAYDIYNQLGEILRRYMCVACGGPVHINGRSCQCENDE